MAVLGNLNLDFDSIYIDIENYIKSNNEIGSALFPSDTGKALAELLAGLQANLNLRLETWVKNAYLPGADIKSAIYNLAYTLGSPPRRKVGASMTARLTLETSLSENVTIPKNSVFSCRDQFWYNRDPVVILSGSTQIDFTIYQGEIVSETFLSNGSSFQSFILQEGSFNIDEDYLGVSISSTSWIRERKSLIFYKDAENKDVFKESTNSDGTVSLLFGNTTFGNIPAVNNNIVVSYAKTVGIKSNSNNTGDEVKLITEILLIDTSPFTPTSISSLTKATGGDDEESPETVKFTSPRLFAANERAVTRSDYEGFLKKYPGVAAVRAWGEKEETTRLGRNDPSTRNQIYFSALKNSLQSKSDDAGQIQSLVSTYNFTISDTDILRGSTAINIGNGKLKYYDIGGYLVSNDVSINSLTGGTSNSSSEDVSNPDSNAFDGDSATYYSSATSPQYTSPVILTYDLGLGNNIDFASIRFQAASLSDYNNRASPKLVDISGSSLVSPDMNNDSNWTTIIGKTSIPELDSQQLTDWLVLNTYPTTYRHLRIKFYDRYGSSNTVKVGSIEIQKNSNLSSINYASSTVSLKVDLAKVSTGDTINYNYTISDYTSEEISNITTYMDNYKFMNCSLNFINPLIKSVDIEADVYYKETTSDVTTIRNQIINSLSSLFSLSQTSIGKDIKISDIINKITSNTDVDWCNLLSPKNNLVVNKNEVLQINSITINLYKTTRT